MAYSRSLVQQKTEANMAEPVITGSAVSAWLGDGTGRDCFRMRTFSFPSYRENACS